jgi:hypothetical protein
VLFRRDHRACPAVQHERILMLLRLLGSGSARTCERPGVPARRFVVVGTKTSIQSKVTCGREEVPSYIALHEEA